MAPERRTTFLTALADTSRAPVAAPVHVGGTHRGCSLACRRTGHSGMSDQFLQDGPGQREGFVFVPRRQQRELRSESSLSWWSPSWCHRTWAVPGAVSMLAKSNSDSSGSLRKLLIDR